MGRDHVISKQFLEGVDVMGIVCQVFIPMVINIVWTFKQMGE